jgi:hypothetical protein
MPITSISIPPTVQRFTSNAGTQSGVLFNVTAANATAGATYTNNSQTFTVLSTIAGGTLLFTSNTTGLPLTSGTLTRTSGTGDATITFSSYQLLLTYTRPINAKHIKVCMVGAGGSGGTGSGGSAGANGTASVFGISLLIANGGFGAPTAGSYAGNGGSFTINSPAVGWGVAGGGGGSGYGGNIAINQTISGMGGSSYFGGAGAGGQGCGSPGTSAAANSGSGGAGSACANNAMGGGGGAGGYIEAFLHNPENTYLYSVGAGGASGGYAGGSGVIIVEEYYS